jgi:hypothetical protein
MFFNTGPLCIALCLCLTFAWYSQVWSSTQKLLQLLRICILRDPPSHYRDSYSISVFEACQGYFGTFFRRVFFFPSAIPFLLRQPCIPTALRGNNAFFYFYRFALSSETGCISATSRDYTPSMPVVKGFGGAESDQF